MSPEDVRARYAARIAALESEHTGVSDRERTLGSARGFALLATLGLGIAGWLKDLPVVLGAAGAAFVAFVWLVVVHARVIARQEDLAARIAWARLRKDCLDRIEADRSVSPSRAPEEGHPFAFDLDVVGARSLLAHLAPHASPYGRDAVASFLLATSAELPSVAEIASRQEAVRELAEHPDALEDLAILGQPLQRGAPPIDRLRAWAERQGELANRPLLASARFLSPLTLLLFVLSRFDRVPAWTPAIPFAITAIATVLLSGATSELFEVAAREGGGVAKLEPLFRRLEALEVRHERLSRSRDVLVRQGSAAASLRSLANILGFADLRRAFLVHLPLNLGLAWDLWVASALLRWRNAHGAELPARCEAAGDLEAMAALATLAHDHPDWCFPTVDDGAPRFVAEGLAHPLLPAGRVANGVEIAAPVGCLLVTGSNMSGKSTLLRSIGTNAVLALAGAPVCARRLEMHRAAVWSSMRVRDSLSDGVSHFYAEILRLRDVVRAAERGEDVLYLLDEVLHGTNSRERIVGAKAVARRLLELGAVGALTSHDLGVTTLSDDVPGKVALGYFCEHVQDGEMRFDYTLRSGVVETTNALRLMKELGLPIGDAG